VLDTGIATHPDLVIAGGVSLVDGVSSWQDGHGHGTHCAGIVGGVAPQCRLHAVKVLADGGFGQGAWTIAGLEWCIRRGIRVANMSLGSRSKPTQAWITAVQRSQASGVTVVCAPDFPWASAPAGPVAVGLQAESPVVVAAVDSSLAIAPSGQAVNFNPVTVVAPGVSVYSTYLGNGYATLSGASVACPHVAGLAALVCQRHPGVSPQLLKARISNTASNLGAKPWPNPAYGHGLIDCGLATR